MRFALAAALSLVFAAPVLGQETAPPAQPVWAFEESDVPVDPAFRFGALENGLRYIIRENNRPEGTALVRMQIGSGSLSERDEERGLAHFLEHMAFNGSRRIPEGEMIKLLEREGLAFGADTNASTGFENTSYRLDLPRNDPALLDTALMLMRETASELNLNPDAIDRERGVILAERRDRRNYSQRETEDRFAFLTPGARYIDRFPIGIPEVLEQATADQFREFYAREYVPANTVLMIVGDFETDSVETAIRDHFSDWAAAPLPVEPPVGPIALERAGETDIYLDPALSERVAISRNTAALDEIDTVASRQQNLLRQIGYRVINRRLQRLAQGEDAPFRSAGFGTGTIFEDGRTTNLIVDTADGGWAKGLEAAALTLRTALAFGFSDAEVSEQVARTRAGQENAVSAASTRRNSSLIRAASALIDDGIVPSTPQSSLERFERFAPYITPAAVLAAVRNDAARLDNPMIRFRGRIAPDGGAAALRSSWNELASRKISRPETIAASQFAYTDFGPAGQVVSDEKDADLGIRKVRFANGVMLNLKQTDLSQDRISFRMNVDGGDLLNTRQNPLVTSLVAAIPAGGLGKHSVDELQTILAGRNARITISSGSDTFVSSGTTTGRDLELQLQLLAATLTDPGYRKEAQTRYRRNVTNYFKTLDATPGNALSASLGSILSDADPRFSLQSEKALKERTFSQLRADIAGRLTGGALEIALVGDFDPEQAIGLVARTLGALPQRETEFQPYTEARNRQFTADRSQRIVTHQGEPDQALLRYTWPTRDDEDLREAQTLELLERVTRLWLQEELREKLGKAYSPTSSNALSGIFPGYGTFSITASVDVSDIEETRAAISRAVNALKEHAVDADTLARARQPLLEAYSNALKSNGSWLGLVDRGQSHPEDIARFLKSEDVIKGISAEDVRMMAERYLSEDAAVEVLVLHESKAKHETVSGG
ncbi:M16 family metallopeptidase [Pontixanthobacter luteolus]|uniref:M16 family metallopeptidase n=1 Tax=Pontixanthobacter luteolus TaxID=295089 RepID=UPI002304C549|nr:insulinase family protein [Pontixanthobacter luteolus]